MIFSNNGKSISKSGDTYFTDKGIVQKSGNMFFGPNASSASETGNTIFGSKGIISVSGNCIYAPNGMYHLSGSILWGPNGKSWSGVGSIEDAKVLVLNDM